MCIIDPHNFNPINMLEHSKVRTNSLPVSHSSAPVISTTPRGDYLQKLDRCMHTHILTVSIIFYSPCDSILTLSSFVGNFFEIQHSDHHTFRSFFLKFDSLIIEYLLFWSNNIDRRGVNCITPRWCGKCSTKCPILPHDWRCVNLLGYLFPGFPFDCHFVVLHDFVSWG